MIFIINHLKENIFVKEVVNRILYFYSKTRYFKFDYKKTMADRAFISSCKFLRTRGPSKIIFSRILRVKTVN